MNAIVARDLRMNMFRIAYAIFNVFATVFTSVYLKIQFPQNYLVILLVSAVVLTIAFLALTVLVSFRLTILRFAIKMHKSNQDMSYVAGYAEGLKSDGCDDSLKKLVAVIGKEADMQNFFTRKHIDRLFLYGAFNETTFPILSDTQSNVSETTLSSMKEFLEAYFDAMRSVGERMARTKIGSRIVASARFNKAVGDDEKWEQIVLGSAFTG